MTSGLFVEVSHSIGASHVVLVVKNLPANAGDIRGAGLIPGPGRAFGQAGECF